MNINEELSIYGKMCGLCGQKGDKGLLNLEGAIHHTYGKTECVDRKACNRRRRKKRWQGKVI